jgi:single-strand selective monofunctional uracil DNA glycosylase
MPATEDRQFASEQLIRAAKRLRDDARKLNFHDQVPWVYNPLDYAWSAHEEYVRRYARRQCSTLFLGMNPGPWGMAQTGVPFGEITAVKNFLQIQAPIRKPAREHPKRPIEGLLCRRSEVSGKRLWGLFAGEFGTAEAFFQHHYVANYCPLVFMEESARNVTPDKLSAAGRAELEAVCDRHLAKLLEILRPKWIVGIGAFAENCAHRVVQRVAAAEVRVGRILHPSPASPAANRDWEGTARAQLQSLGIW